MAATTTDNNTSLPHKLYLRPYSTQVGKSTDAGAMGANLAANLYGIGGMAVATTAKDYIRLPVNDPQSQGVLLFIYNAYSTQSGCYPAVLMRNNAGSAMSPGFSVRSASSPASVGVALGTTEVKGGYTLYQSTAAFINTSSQSATYTLGPIDYGRHMLMSNTSNGAIDAYQGYLEFIPTKSTAAANAAALQGTTCTFANLTTTPPCVGQGGCFAALIEV